MDAETKQRPLTTRTRISLAIARGIAAARGDGDLGATHVLLGLLREGRNPAASVVEHADVATSVIASELETELGPRGDPQPRQVVLDLTQGEDALLRRADLEAQQRGEPYIGTEHLLLAILSDEGNAASRVLSRHALSSAEARAKMDEVTGGRHAPGEGRSERPEA